MLNRVLIGDNRETMDTLPELTIADIADAMRECAGCGSLSIFTRCPCCGRSEMLECERPVCEPLAVCPRCKWAGTDDDFDGLGCDDQFNVACPNCQHEFALEGVAEFPMPGVYSAAGWGENPFSPGMTICPPVQKKGKRQKIKAEARRLFT